MKRELKITIKKDYNHYALIEQVNNRENEINRGIFLDKDQYEQLRQHFVSGSLPSQELIEMLKECRGLLVMCTLIDKSGHCKSLVDKVDTKMGWQ